ncbi:MULTISPECIES: hypothetical protein [Streptomyces]|uniref:Uncharacterized protein n=2 Tax=Streptomyces TaxID=1883 RepID=A0ABV9J5T3_9ACTN
MRSQVTSGADERHPPRGCAPDSSGDRAGPACRCRRDDVTTLPVGNPVASRFADGIQLLSTQGKAIHWARRMLKPGVACVLDSRDA